MTAVLQKPGTSLRSWRSIFLNCALVPVTVTAPLLYLAGNGDHRYNVYWHGALVQDHPWRLVTENLRTVPMYLDFGNFRPLGRMTEWALDAAAYVLIEVTHLPAQVGLRVVSALAAAALTAVAVVFAEALTARGRMFDGPPARTIALLPFAIGGSLTAAGQVSSTVLFGGLYFLSAALVLGVAAWVGRGPRLGVLVVVAGATLALFNEVAALGPPLATAAALARTAVIGGRLFSRRGECVPQPFDRRGECVPRPFDRRGEVGLRPALLLWAGFLPVFVPVRVLLYLSCRDGGCYGNSDVLFGPGVGAAFANRVTSWLPPLQWGDALRDGGEVSRIVLGLAVLVLALLAARLFARLPQLPRLDRRQAGALAATGGAVLLLGGLLGSLNAQTQAFAADGRWGAGWRDGGLLAAGGGLLLAGLLALATRALVARVGLGVFVLVAAGTAAVNHAFAQATNRMPYALVAGAVAAEVAQFDTTAAGNARRCALIARFEELFRDAPYSRFAAGELPGTHSVAERMSVAASMATEQMYGRPFCR
ncbi:hypothetical protein ACQPZX_42965 [Actinoplanes sp. CA-142083]|uniref:hypothetical protein n=1 Tax=Actinoplanes sp. CA-142083 TaxID=3239903 RepID=UPI003D8EBACE